jgi:internalin A
MKKIVILMLIVAAITSVLSTAPVLAQVTVTPHGVIADFSNKGITNEQLAEMIKTGEIPYDTTSLWLNCNQLSDLTSLNMLPYLQSLRLINIQITDVTSLIGLVGLEELWLCGNELTDISPLANLTNLHTLIIRDNQITDLTPLANLTNLGREFGTGLFLCNNQITDISPLANLTNLGVLDLQGNQITDVTPLQGLNRLWILDLRDNQIEDVSPLAWLTRLDSSSLRLSGNPVTENREALQVLAAARERNTTRVTLTLGHVLGTRDYTIADAIEILRYIVGVTSVLDDCEVAMIAALIVSEDVPTIQDALQILRHLVGLPSALDGGHDDGV